jgi:hypothetical protein
VEDVVASELMRLLSRLICTYRASAVKLIAIHTGAAPAIFY